jgi:TonB-linked SusC/RagA family outer membrane protein
MRTRTLPSARCLWHAVLAAARPAAVASAAVASAAPVVAGAVFAALLLVPFGNAAYGQDAYVIEGRVVEAPTGQPLPGANVQLEATSIGSATQDDGTFSLDARLDPGTYTLRVTFVGYRPTEETVTLGNASTVEVGTLALEPDIAGLDEVVVTGQAGPTRRRELGNALSSIEAADLQEAPNTSTLQSLQGQIAGARIQQSSGDPAGGTDIRLRGTGTVLGAADPLIVIDGVIVSNDSPELIQIGGTTQNRLVDINPNDIARIEVVKGAAAAALYGSRANNGVVQIFTKQGEIGQTRVTYSTRLETQNVRNTLDVNMAQNDEGAFLDNGGDPLPEGEQRWDWQDFIFDRAWGTEQYLSVSGASGDTRFFTSGSFFGTQGIVDESGFRRYNGTARLQRTVADWVNVSAGARYSYSESDDVPNGGLNSNYGALTGFIFGPNTFDPRPNDLGEFPGDAVLSNPLEVQSQFDFGQETSRFIGDFQVDLTPLQGLSVNYILGLDTYEQVGLAFIPRGVSSPGFGSGFSRRAELSNLQLNSDLTVRYETELTSSLRSTSLVGGTVQHESEETFSAESQDLPPISETVGGGSALRQFGEFRSPLTVYGVFGQQTVGWADRLFVTGALRFDASSSFGDDERWQFYPKGSLSYVLSEYDFWQESVGDAVSSFKLRASVGTSGGLTSIGAFDRFTVYNAQSYGGVPGLQPSTQLGAQNVRPERQLEIEVGADMSLLRERVALNVTYYDQTTNDLLLTRTLAPSTGFNTRLANVGTVENRGLEVRARGVVLQRENLRWTSTATYARNRNEVSDIPGETGRVTIPSSFGISVAQNGESIGSFFGSAFERNDAGDVVDVNGNPLERDDDGYWRLQEGTISEEGDGIPSRATDPTIIGDPQPSFSVSWINQVQIRKNLRLRVQLDGEFGQDVFNFTRRLGAFGPFGTLEDYERELEGDLPSGYNGAVFGIFENWVEDATYIKLREVAISYTLALPSLPFERVEFNAAGRNLFSIDDYSGYDPEVNVGGQRTGVRGFDFVVPPIPRTYSVGATFTF